MLPIPLNIFEIPTLKKIENLFNIFEILALNANDFFIQNNDKLSQANILSKQFLQYSANDIYFTAISALNILIKDKLEAVKQLSLIKLQQFNDCIMKNNDPHSLRQARYSVNDITSILQGRIIQDQKINKSLDLWSKIKTISNLKNSTNQAIQEILQLRPEHKEKIDERLVYVETYLKNNINRILPKTLLELIASLENFIFILTW